MNEPKRIQRKRTKGWKLPEGAICVTRPGKWGNPYRGFADTAFAVQLYRTKETQMVDAARRELRGKDLACWCPIGSPCHADVLLEWANS